MLGVLERVQLGGQGLVHRVGKGQATALRGHKRGLGGLAFLHRVNAAFDLGARLTGLVAGLR